MLPVSREQIDYSRRVVVERLPMKIAPIAYVQAKPRQMSEACVRKSCLPPRIFLPREALLLQSSAMILHFVPIPLFPSLQFPHLFLVLFLFPPCALAYAIVL